MKSPDSPLSERRPTSRTLSDEPGPVRSEEREAGLRVDPPEHNPWERRGSSGARNLLLGTLILLIALGLLGQAIYLMGPEAVLPLGSALLAVVTLFVLARARLLRQKNGGFLALGLVCLVAAAVPLAEYAWSRAGQTKSAVAAPSSLNDAARNADEQAAETPLLTESFQVPEVTANAERFKVLRDFHVEMSDGKVYLIKAGEVLPLAERAEGEVRFLAENQKIGLPERMVEMLPASSGSQSDAATPTPSSVMPGLATAPTTETPAPPEGQAETPAQITERSQKEAIRRYPGLGQRDSPENQLFIETYQELKHSGADDFFADPEWPLQLAELLAKRENWQRQ